MRIFLAVALAFAVILSGTTARAAAPDQTKPDQVKPDQARHVKPDQAKPDQVRLAKPDQAKPDQVKPDQGKAGKHKVVYAKHAKLRHKLAHVKHFKHAKLYRYA